MIALVLFILTGVLYSFNKQDSASNSIIGSDSNGFVAKVVYSHPITSGSKIAVITGMHPRETSAKDVVPQVIKDYAQSHNVEIVNYQIYVTNDPTDFTVGRHSGESLVAKYVIPDIEKSNYNLVIICHDHKKGYGNGYYIATPTMDNKSVDLAESLHNLIPDFNYYQRNVDQKTEETSINAVDYPITNSGTPVFVYEIPEWLGNSDVYNNTTRLIDTSFKVI